MKHLLLFVFVFALLSSCQKDDENSLNKMELKLKSNKTAILPFEDIKVSIDVDVDLETFCKFYDSVTWKANGMAYYGLWNQWVNKDKWNDRRFTDYRFDGTYTIYAFGYKDGEVISKDSVKYTMRKPYGSFLDFQWGDEKNNQYLSCTIGLSPKNYIINDRGVLSVGSVILSCDRIVENLKNGQKEYVAVSFTQYISEVLTLNSVSTKSSSSTINDFDWQKYLAGVDQSIENPDLYKMEGEFLFNYISELYGSPKFIFSGADVRETDLSDEFNERFDLVRNDFYPEVIWETPYSNVCMLRSYSRLTESNNRGAAIIIAQPRATTKP